MGVEIEMNIEYPGEKEGGSPLYRGENVGKDPRYLYLKPMEKPIHSILEDLESKYQVPLKGVHIVHEDTVRNNHKRIQKAFQGSYTGNEVSEAWAFKSFHVEAVAALAKESGAWADVGSRGELELALKVGIDPEKIICTGPAKDDSELEKIIEAGALCVVDSYDEAEALNALAKEKGVVIDAGMRINPHPSGAKEIIHSNIFTSDRDSKFGIPVEGGHAGKTALQIQENCKNLKLILIHFHIGSQIPDLDVYEAAVRSGAVLVKDLRGEGIGITTLDIGGGYPFSYLPEQEARKIEESEIDTHMKLYSGVTIDEIAQRVSRTLETEFAGQEPIEGSSLPKLHIETGRFVMGGAVGTLGRVLTVKNYKEFVTWLQTTISTREFHHKMTTKELMYQIAIADRMNEPHDFPVSIGGELCNNADVMVSHDVQVLLPRPERGNFIYYANTGAYSIFCAANSHNIPRMPIVLVDKQGRVSIIREPEARERVTELDAFPGIPL